MGKLLLKTPAERLKAYNDGLKGAPVDKKLLKDTQDRLRAAAAPYATGLQAILKRRQDKRVKKGRALLWRYRDKFDPGASGKEPQTTGDCTSHGTRNAIDWTRACDILIRGDAEKYFVRTSCEMIYAFRGFSGQGMDPSRAASATEKYGTLGRLDYGIIDLRVYNSDIGSRMGRSGPSAAILKLMAAHTAVDWVTADSVDDAKDFFDAGFGAMSGQSFGFQSTPGKDGIFIPGPRWNHCMGSGGYDDTCEFFPKPVMFVPNSWGAWCRKPANWPEEAYGPYPPGLIVVEEEVWANNFLNGMYFCLGMAGYMSDPITSYGFDY